MARVQNSGLEIMADQLEGLERATVQRIVMAGADALTEETKRHIDAYHHVDTGAMREGVKAGQYREWMGGGAVDVYPQGDGSRGVSNAKKAFVIDRGLGHRPMTKRSRGKERNKTGDNFLTKKTVKAAEEVTVQAMEAEFDRIIAENNR